MRLFPSLALAGAALALAAPAAAQPRDANDPGPRIMLGAMEQASRNIPANVSGYLVEATSGPLQSQVYVYRDGPYVFASVADHGPIGETIGGMVLWHRFASEHYPGITVDDADASDARYVRADSLDGRPVHVLVTTSRWMGGAPLVQLADTTLVYVDAETRQVLRVSARGSQEATGAGPFARGGQADVSMSFGGWREVDGVTVPGRMRMEMRLRLDLTDEEREAARQEMAALAAEADGEARMGDEQAGHAAYLIRQFMRVLDGEPLEVEAVLGAVQVNPTRPDWAL